MAVNQRIRLQIISALDDAGIKATAEELERLEAKVNATSSSTGKLSSDFKGHFNAMTATSAVLSGNFEAMGQQLVMLGAAVKGVTLSLGTMTGVGLAIGAVVGIVKKLVSAFKEQKTAVQEAEEAASKGAKAIADAQKAARDAIKSATSGVDDAAKRRDAELESIQKEVAAEKQLQMETARRNGDLETAAKLQREIAADVKAEAVKRKENAIADVDAKIEAINKKIVGAEDYDVKKAEKARRRINGQIMASRAALEKAQKGQSVSNGMGGTTTVINYEEVDRLKEQLEQLEDAKRSLLKRNTAGLEGKKEIDALKADRMNLERDLSAYRKIQIAEEIKAESEVLKVEDKRHEEKMKHLQDEANAMQSAAAVARSRAEKEFQLYKSGNAAAQIEAEKQDAEARKRLQKDASRYGGKWRIDELAKLYGEGDEKKIGETLQEWRKSKSFTPEVEAMVRAAAADQNATTLEDRVSEIAENTRNLAEKVEELLTMKGE